MAAAVLCKGLLWPAVWFDRCCFESSGEGYRTPHTTELLHTAPSSSCSSGWLMPLALGKGMGRMIQECDRLLQGYNAKQVRVRFNFCPVKWKDARCQGLEQVRF